MYYHIDEEAHYTQLEEFNTSCLAAAALVTALREMKFSEVPEALC